MVHLRFPLVEFGVAENFIDRSKPILPMRQLGIPGAC